MYPQQVQRLFRSFSKRRARPVEVLYGDGVEPNRELDQACSVLAVELAGHMSRIARSFAVDTPEPSPDVVEDVDLDESGG